MVCPLSYATSLSNAHISGTDSNLPCRIATFCRTGIQTVPERSVARVLSFEVNSNPSRILLASGISLDCPLPCLVIAPKKVIERLWILALILAPYGNLAAAQLNHRNAVVDLLV